MSIRPLYRPYSARLRLAGNQTIGNAAAAEIDNAGDDLVLGAVNVDTAGDELVLAGADTTYANVAANVDTAGDEAILAAVDVDNAGDDLILAGAAFTAAADITAAAVTRIEFFAVCSDTQITVRDLNRL